MSERRSIVVVGAGGFAREVRWLINDINRAGGAFDFRGYVVSDRATLGPGDDIERVIGEVGDLESGELEADALAIGIGSPRIRASIGSQLAAALPQVDLPSLVHPSVLGDLESWSIGRGTLLCAGVVGTVNVVLSDFALANLSCTIGHEAQIGVGSVLFPLVSVSGGVTIGDRTLIGTGANILQYVSIGDDAAVGAGAVVVKNVESGITVAGVPARKLGDG